MSWTKGWKAFDTVEGRTDAGMCRGFLFEEGETYKIEGALRLCENGFHACKDAVLCFEYYPNAVLFAEVEFLGKCEYAVPTKHKGATSKIRIVKFHTSEELLKGYYNSGDYNSGDYNSGDYNSGDYNSGDYNSGYYNSGYYNSGYYNSGYYNSGDYNSGNRNSGDYNSGNRNSGYYNSGNYNSGNWNSCDRETGFFNTKETQTVNIFNKPCSWEVWLYANKPSFIFFDLDEQLGYKGSWKKAYSTASKEERKLLLKLPNFDKDVFFELTGINVEED